MPAHVLSPPPSLSNGRRDRFFKPQCRSAFGAEQFAGVRGRQVVLSHVQAGLEQHGEIGAVVDDERRASYAA
jgi:hypothetical protein